MTLNRPLIPCVRYIRCSSAIQASDSRYGLDRQRWAAEECEEKHGLKMVAEVQDVITGVSESRTGLDSLPAVAVQHGAVAISLPQVDRLTRAEFITAYKILSAIIDTGLDVYASDLKTRVNARDPESVREVNKRLEAAYEERHRTRDRTYTGMLVKMAVKKLPVRPPKFYGFRDGQIYEPEAIWARFMYAQAYQDGTKTINDKLAERGVLTSRGGAWQPSIIYDLLVNPVYKGEWGFGREFTCIECLEKRTGTSPEVRKAHKSCPRCGAPMRLKRYTVEIPAIIPPDEWEAVQRALHARSSRPGRRGGRLDQYPLTGRIICGVCGGSMSGFTQAVYKHRYYRCSSSRRAGTPNRCSHRTCYHADAVHEAVLRELRSYVDIPGVLEARLELSHADPYARERSEAKASTAILQDRLVRLEKGYLNGIVSLEKAIEERITAQTALAKLPTPPPAPPTPPDAATLRQTLQAAMSGPLEDTVREMNITVELELGGMVHVVVQKTG